MANPVCTTKKGKRRLQYETEPTLELGWETGQKIYTKQENKICTKKNYIGTKARNSNCSKHRKKTEV